MNRILYYASLLILAIAINDSEKLQTLVMLTRQSRGHNVLPRSKVVQLTESTLREIGISAALATDVSRLTFATYEMHVIHARAFRCINMNARHPSSCFIGLIKQVNEIVQRVLVGVSGVAKAQQNRAAEEAHKRLVKFVSSLDLYNMEKHFHTVVNTLSIYFTSISDIVTIVRDGLVLQALSLFGPLHSISDDLLLSQTKKVFKAIPILAIFEPVAELQTFKIAGAYIKAAKIARDSNQASSDDMRKQFWLVSSSEYTGHRLIRSMFKFILDLSGKLWGEMISERRQDRFEIPTPLQNTFKELYGNHQYNRDVVSRSFSKLFKIDGFSLTTKKADITALEGIASELIPAGHRSVVSKRRLWSCWYDLFDGTKVNHS